MSTVPLFARALLATIGLSLTLILSPASSLRAAGVTRPPNVVFFLADDLGYGDLSCYGQTHIRTPAIDRLASGGMRLTQLYSGNAVCAPSRCVLMTGLHPGHAFIRNNRAVPPEGQYPIPAHTVTLAKLLQAVGYATGAFGKWGLGPPGSEGDPLRQGFERFFGYNCQAVAHNYYPTMLWSNSLRVPLDNPAFAAHQKLPANGPIDDPASYTPYTGAEYAPDLIAEEARRFVRANKDRPFLLYFPTTVPHLSLQVPEDSLAEYRGKFDETPYDGRRGYLPQRTPRAAYAAMITRMDREVGRIVELIESLGLDRDTIFIFSSDNGPVYDHLGGSDSEFFKSAGPFRGLKGSLYEGGVRVPGIVRWRGHIQPNSTSDRVVGFEDWLPTILTLVGAAGSIPPGVDGIDFSPTILGRAQPPREFLYREFPDYGGQQSLRCGDWKLVRQNLLPKSKDEVPSLAIELYNLADDVGEQHNVAAEHPEVVARLSSVLRAQHVPSQAFPFPALDQP